MAFMAKRFLFQVKSVIQEYKTGKRVSVPMKAQAIDDAGQQVGCAEDYRSFLSFLEGLHRHPEAGPRFRQTLANWVEEMRCVQPFFLRIYGPH